MPQPSLADPSLADAAQGIRHVFVRDLLLNARIGVYASEHDGAQRIRVNVDLAVLDPAAALPGGVGADTLDRVVDYSRIVESVRNVVAAQHVQLVETLAERLAAACMADERIVSVRVQVEKLDILPDGATAGVEIERRRTELSTTGKPA